MQQTRRDSCRLQLTLMLSEPPTQRYLPPDDESELSKILQEMLLKATEILSPREGRENQNEE